jgi:pyruvate-formate lyase
MKDQDIEQGKSAVPESPKMYRKVNAIMSPMMNRMHINCRDIYQLSVEKLDRQLAFNEKIRLWVHTALCSYCRSVPQQLEEIAKVIAKLEREQGEETKSTSSLNEAERTAMVFKLRGYINLQNIPDKINKKDC